MDKKKIAVHKEAGSFSDRWIPYLKAKGIPFVEVDCYDSGIISALEGVDCLLWHWHLCDQGSSHFAKELTLALQQKGISLFPDYETSWHYDDKIAQKYLFEALGFPIVPSYVFYSREKALKWVKSASFPKVFKLRCGAGSLNVSLVRNSKEARRLVNRAFGRGFPILNRKAILQERIRHLRLKRTPANVWRLIGSLGRCLIGSNKEGTSPAEVGYAYFQDYIPDNTHDTRMVVIGDRCIAVRRYCRNGDFRASGSGDYSHDLSNFPISYVELAYEWARKLKMQSAAFDLIEDKGKPVLLEASYCYIMGPFYDDCPGYWTPDLRWIETEVDPQKFILEDFLKENSITA